MANAYPLEWPANFPRATRRESGSFKTPMAKALKNVHDSLRLFASDSRTRLEGLVISSNVSLGATKPTDPGVSVWFVWSGMQVVIPVDRYSSVEANLQAIHYIVEARRVELRHGTLALVRASFAGFLALGHESSRPWWDVLGVAQNASRDVIEGAYKRRRSECHPDRPGGTPEAFDELVKAYDRATA